MFNKRIVIVLAVVGMFVMHLVSCSGKSAGTGEFYEELGKMASEEENGDFGYEIIPEAKNFINRHENLFMASNENDVKAYVDEELDYRAVSKSPDKYGDKLMKIQGAYVISINEHVFDDGTKFTEMQVYDDSEKNYYILCMDELEDIYEDDIVYIYALPLGMTSFDNVDNGKTIALMMAGSYVGKIEMTPENDNHSNHIFTNEDNVKNYTLPVEIVNNTGVDIYYLFASTEQTDNWEEDILGNDYLPNGYSKTIDFIFTENELVWDFAIADMDGNMLEFYGLDFSQCSIYGATLELEYDGQNGYANLY